MVILNLYGIPSHAVVVFRPEQDFLFKSFSTYCEASQKLPEKSPQNHAKKCSKNYPKNLPQTLPINEPKKRPKNSLYNSTKNCQRQKVTFCLLKVL